MALTNIAGVQFQRAGRIYDYQYKNLALEVGDEVLVDSVKGEAVARISVLKFEFVDPSQQADIQLKKVLRKVSTHEITSPHYPGDSEAKRLTEDIVTQLNLNMEVTQCQLQGINKQKVLVYFVSTERVDFRNLVKQLATQFKMRIELRQIGPRDQAKLVGGIGICGREYCCSSFLREFIPVSIKMAKNQNLALNPNQVSGGCGRLLCCLSYEDSIYTQLRKNLPKVGSIVVHKFSALTATVLSLDVLNQKVTLRDSEGTIDSYPASELQFDTSARSGSPGSRKNKKSSHKKDSSTQRNSGWGEDLDIAALIQFQDSLEQPN